MQFGHHLLPGAVVDQGPAVAQGHPAILGQEDHALSGRYQHRFQLAVQLAHHLQVAVQLQRLAQDKDLLHALLPGHVLLADAVGSPVAHHLAVVGQAGLYAGRDCFVALLLAMTWKYGIGKAATTGPSKTVKVDLLAGTDGAQPVGEAGRLPVVPPGREVQPLLVELGPVAVVFQEDLVLPKLLSAPAGFVIRRTDGRLQGRCQPAPTWLLSFLESRISNLGQPGCRPGALRHKLFVVVAHVVGRPAGVLLLHPHAVPVVDKARHLAGHRVRHHRQPVLDVEPLLVSDHLRAADLHAQRHVAVGVVLKVGAVAQTGHGVGLAALVAVSYPVQVGDVADLVVGVAVSVSALAAVGLGRGQPVQKVVAKALRLRQRGVCDGLHVAHFVVGVGQVQQVRDVDALQPVVAPEGGGRIVLVGGGQAVAQGHGLGLAQGIVGHVLDVAAPQ